MLNVKQESCEYQLFKSLVWLDEEIKSRFTDYEADAQTEWFALQRNSFYSIDDYRKKIGWGVVQIRKL